MRYFDHNATHPLSTAARAAWLDAVDRYPANPSSPHRWGARAAQALESARESLAQLLGCPAGHLVWTSGATEANNALIQHVAQTSSGPVLISGLEHPSLRVAARRRLASRWIEIPTLRSGIVDVSWLQDRLLAGDVSAVLVMAANNETGVLQPWPELAMICQRQGVFFGCDAAQWLGRLPAAGLGACDALTASAHKLGGPPGVGFLKAPENLVPWLVGGPQEEGRRAGTENVPGILAFLAALLERESQMQSELLAQRTRWRDQFVAELNAKLPGIEVVGGDAPRLWNTVSVLMPPSADCRRRWVVKLDRLGFAVSTGSACASGQEKPSEVLKSMGYRPDESDRMLRFSAGWDTTESDWQALQAGLLQAATELLAAAPRERSVTP